MAPSAGGVEVRLGALAAGCIAYCEDFVAQTIMSKQALRGLLPTFNHPRDGDALVRPMVVTGQHSGDALTQDSPQIAAPTMSLLAASLHRGWRRIP